MGMWRISCVKSEFHPISFKENPHERAFSFACPKVPLHLSPRKSRLFFAGDVSIPSNDGSGCDGAIGSITP
jgi:hypothetical protein